jgi:hypothetical protein
MRLTLRTLLAYLDDTLPPSEAKLMGAKLAESEPAQEIVERIKNVIRRRRLTVPPPTNRMDPNTIAEYLDNEITPELAEELERICLASDVHLAEVAACHQMLSLVLGEPPAAPEDAVKRMVALAKGETGKSPRRKAGAAAAAERTTLLEKDADETLRMGLPSVFGKNKANLAMIGAVAVLASLLLVVSIMQLLKKPELVVEAPIPTDQVAKVDLSKKTEEKILVEPIKVAPTPEPVVEEKKATPEVKEPPPPAPVEKEPKVVDLPPPAFTSGPDAKTETVLAKIVFGPANPKVAPIGQLLEPAKGTPAIVMQQIPKSTDWKRLGGKNPEVSTNRPIVSLPGSKAIVTTHKGVRVTLWGNIPEQNPQPPVLESAATFYDHDTLDLDMTHLRGRLLIANLREDPAVLRIRFENPSEPGAPETYWLLTFTGPNAEAMIDRWSFMPTDEPFMKLKDQPERKGPIAQMACMTLSGTVFLKTPTESVTLPAPPSPNLALWDSRTKKLQILTQPPPPWLDAKAVAPPEFAKVRTELNSAFTGKAVDVAMAELLKSNDLLTRRTAVRCLGAMDDLPGLFDMLTQDKKEQRDAAVETLRAWVALSRDNDYLLYDLANQRLKANEAEVFMTLLHGFSPASLSRPETYELLIEHLRHKQQPIRELAAWNLYHMVPAAKNIPYDAADATMREKAYQMWLKLIPPGKLPPTPKMKSSVDAPAPFFGREAERLSFRADARTWEAIPSALRMVRRGKSQEM